MNIIYFANFQTEKLISARNIQKNRSLAGSSKIRTITKRLSSTGNNVDIFSIGQAAENSWKYFPAFDENIDDSGSCVFFGFCLDIKFISGITSILSVLSMSRQILKKKEYNLALVYNCDLPSLLFTIYARYIKKIPVVLEYEDSIRSTRNSKFSLKKIFSKYQEKIMSHAVTGVFAPSQGLLNSIDCQNKLLLPGVIKNELLEASLDKSTRLEPEVFNLLYSGHLEYSKGVDILLAASQTFNFPYILNIVGSGPQKDELCNLVKKLELKNVYIRGFVPDEELIKYQVNADICINPHREMKIKGSLWPFKIVEYLCACGVVVSTNVDSDNIDLNANLITVDFTEESLGNKVNDIVLNWSTLATKAESSREWARHTYSGENLNNSLAELISNA